MALAHYAHLLLTLILYIGLNQGAHDPCTTNTSTTTSTVTDLLGYNETDMQFTAFKVLEDSVVFDWFITLEQKER